MAAGGQWDVEAMMDGETPLTPFEFVIQNYRLNMERAERLMAMTKDGGAVGTTLTPEIVKGALAALRNAPDRHPAWVGNQRGLDALRAALSTPHEHRWVTEVRVYWHEDGTFASAWPNTAVPYEGYLDDGAAVFCAGCGVKAGEEPA